MQDFLTTSALALFPIVAACLFALQPFNRAAMLTVLLAQLLLPVGAVIKFEQIPQFDKSSIPSLCLIVGCAATGRLRFRSPKGISLIGIFAVMFLFGPVITSEFNGEPLQYGPLRLPGVGLYDAVSALMTSVITLTPYFVGRELLRDEADNGEILRLMVISMLAYSIPLLIEVRLSPQFHYWFYGYYPSMFAQSIRDGGFRPMVFMGHGLVLAHFTLLAFLSAMAFWRIRKSVIRISPRVKSNFRLVATYLGVVLFFCKTLGASLYGLFLSPIILFASAKIQMRVAVIFVFLTLLYPTMRYLDVVPTENLVELANSFSPERGESLGFRFYNERLLLNHAIKKPYFGWGRFGRNRVYDEDTGKDLTLTDGEWIIVLGQFGAIGFIAEFGLLCMAVFRAAAALRFAQSEREKILLSVLALMVAASIFDLLPNAFLEPWTWLIAGALLGRAEALLARRTIAAKLPTATDGFNQFEPRLQIEKRLKPISDRT